MALQSFVLLIAVTRICGTEIAGTYSVAFAVAQVLWTIGVFEATTFFTTDAANRFSAEQYLAFKICSCSLMLICGLAYVLFRSLPPYSAHLTIALCCFKLVDAFNEYFFALFQKNGKLDVAGFSVFCQAVLSTAILIVSLVLGRDVLLAVVLATAGKIIFNSAYNLMMTRRYVSLGLPDFFLEDLSGIFWGLLPLFLAAFCSNYIANITKFAIEQSSVASLQAVYNILFMPSFAINLLVLFFLRPSLTVLAEYWRAPALSKFRHRIVKLLAGVLVVSIFVIFVAGIVGIPLLEIVFGVDLEGQTPCLLVLLVGSGLASASLVFYNVFIVMRRQIVVLAVYCFVALICFPISKVMVDAWGLMGAAYSYVVVYGIMFSIFAASYCILMRSVLAHRSGE